MKYLCVWCEKQKDFTEFQGCELRRKAGHGKRCRDCMTAYKRAQYHGDMAAMNPLAKQVLLNELERRRRA